jgi:membrane protein implicated in regulation of membrane protease activity
MAFNVNGNGNGNGSAWKIAGILFGLLISLLTWNARREVERADTRILSLEQSAADANNRITVLQALRPEDRRLIEQLVAEVSRQGRLTDRIAARLGVEEK